MKQTPKVKAVAPPWKTQKIEDLRVLMANTPEKPVQFEIEADPKCLVFIAGTFNGWDPTSHPLEYHLEDEVFRVTLLLEPGTYEYRFVVNGVWQTDPKCGEQVQNAYGSVNSVVRV